MTRRTAFIAAAAIAAFGFTASVQTADALTIKTRQCVKEARVRLKQRTVDARTEARAAFASEFASCFGPGAQCASDCQAEQAGCQQPFNDAASAARATCKAQFDAALAACRNPEEADPQACAAAARLTQFACNQVAAADAAPGLQGCNAQFSDCVGACASER